MEGEGIGVSVCLAMVPVLVVVLLVIVPGPVLVLVSRFSVVGVAAVGHISVVTMVGSLGLLGPATATVSEALRSTVGLPLISLRLIVTFQPTRKQTSSQ